MQNTVVSSATNVMNVVGNTNIQQQVKIDEVTLASAYLCVKTHIQCSNSFLFFIRVSRMCSSTANAAAT